MEIIIYSHGDNPQKDKLLKEVSQVSNLTYVMASDFKSLFSLVKSKISDQVVIVFLISLDKELEFLISNRMHLFNSRYIIILPNEEERIISIGFSLSPRYLAHTGYGFKDVAAVLENMIKHNNNIITGDEPGSDVLQ